MSKSKENMAEVMNLMKMEILNQMKKDKEELDKKISNSNKEISNTIKSEINAVRKDVQENKDQIDAINKRLDEIEKPKTLADIVKLPPRIIPQKKNRERTLYRYCKENSRTISS